MRYILSRHFIPPPLLMFPLTHPHSIKHGLFAASAMHCISYTSHTKANDSIITFHERVSRVAIETSSAKSKLTSLCTVKMIKINHPNNCSFLREAWSGQNIVISAIIYITLDILQ